MRPIKFRVWDTLFGRMVQSFEMGKLFITFEGEVGILEDSSHGVISVDVDDNRFIVMQYTGLDDINGINIYEGDIITNYHNDIQVVEYIGGRWRAVLKKRGTSFWPAQYLDCTYMDWRVIGNIYENAELLDPESVIP